MLKTREGDRIVLITQPDHARLSGYLAAHWGGGEFAAPGRYAASSDPDALREEAIFAVTEHDNGWWEWEADPRISASDGLPAGLGEILDSYDEAAERWRLGVRRFAQTRPHASIILGRHPYWLYAWQLGRAPEDRVHPLHHGKFPDPPEEAARVAEALLRDLETWEAERRREIERNGPTWAREGLADEHLLPHARLVQALDGFSLALCSDVVPSVDGAREGLGAAAVDLLDIPRRSWDDRVTLRLRPRGERALTVDPYPFDEAPLRAPVRARIVEPGAGFAAAGAGCAEQTLVFELHPA